jgi:hypothetical protein
MNDPSAMVERCSWVLKHECYALSIHVDLYIKSLHVELSHVPISWNLEFDSTGGTVTLTKSTYPLMSQSKISKYCVMARLKDFTTFVTQHVTRPPWRCMPFSPWRSLIPMPLTVLCVGKVPPLCDESFPALQKLFFVPFLLAFGMHHDALACAIENDSFKSTSHCNYPLDYQEIMSYIRYWCVVLDCPVGFIGTLLNTCVSGCNMPKCCVTFCDGHGHFYNQPFFLWHVEWPNQSWI